MLPYWWIKHHSLCDQQRENPDRQTGSCRAATSRDFGLSNSPDPHATEVKEEAFGMGRPSKPRAGIKQCRVQLAPSILEFTLNCSCILFRFVQWPAVGQEPVYYYNPADILERSRVRLNRNWCQFQRSTLFMVDINFMIQTFFSC